MIRLLCTGDLHLGAGADIFSSPRDRLADQEQVLAQIADLADEHNVDAILFAGDAFEGPIVHPEHYAVWQRQLAAQRVIAITGNGRHDAAMRDVKAPEILRGNSHVISSQPDVVHYNGFSVATLPWSPVGRLVAAADGGPRDDINAHAAELLIDIARGLLLEARDTAPGGYASQPVVLMMHWSISGAALPNGLPVDEFAREPIVCLRELETLGYDAVVAGHIHKPQLLSPGPLGENGDGSHVVDKTCPVFYVGSPLPLNFGEAACEHGCWLLELNGEARATFLPLESRPFRTLDFDFTSPETDYPPYSLEEEIARCDWGDAIVRVRYRATEEQGRRVDQHAVRKQLLEQGAARVYVQADIVRETRARVEGVDEELAPLTALDLWLQAERLDDPLRHAMRTLTSGYLEEGIAA